MKAVPIGVPVQGIAGLLLAAAVLSTATGWANESDATAVAAATEVELATQVITGVKESPQVCTSCRGGSSVRHRRLRRRQ